MYLKFIITVGISGSGKSTYIKSLNTNEVYVVCPDQIREYITGDISNQSENKSAWDIALKTIVKLLNEGTKDVVLDATNLRSKERRHMLSYLRENVTNAFDAYAKVFYVSSDIAKKRIKADLINNVNRSRVSDESIDRQYNRFKGNIDKLKSDGYILL